MYEIAIDEKALDFLSGQPRKIQRQIMRKIDGLAADPHPPGSRKLHAKENLYRIRSGHFRVIYAVDKKKILVLILHIGHRKEVYDWLKNIRGKQ